MSGHERERLCAYHDGELPLGERAAVAAHLAACPECTALLADMAAVDAAVASLPAGAPEGYFDALPSRVVARLGAAAKAPARTRRLPAWTWAAAAALLLAVVAPLTLRQPVPGPASAVPPTPGAPEVALRDRDQRRARDAVAAPAATPTSAARTRPAFASPPTAAAPGAPAVTDDRLPAGKPGESEAESGRGPLFTAPAERAIRPKRADAPTQSAVREGPALLRTEALGAQEGARTSARQAPTAASVESSVHRDEVTGGAGSAPEPEVLFGRLETSRPRTAAEWRRLGDAWSAFAAAYPADPRADEARVRAIEARREAWLAGGDDDDAAVFLRDAQAYIEREDARQKERVERLLPLPSRRP